MNNRLFLYLVLIVFLVPFLLLCIYTYPGMEDYDQSLLSQDLGVLGHFKDLYFTFDGRYFVAILYAINPLVYYNFTIYKILPLLHFIGLYLGLLLLLRNIFPKSAFSNHLLLSVLLLVLGLYHFPFLPAAFYYMVSAMVYFTPLVLTLFLCSFLILLYKTENKGLKLLWLLLSCIAIVSILGCNEMYLILIPFIISSVVIFQAYHFKTQYLESFTLLFAVAAGIYLQLSAPALDVVIGEEVYTIEYLSQQLLVSIVQVFKQTCTWLQSSYLLWAITLLYIPLGKRIITMHDIFLNYRNSILIFFLLFCIVYLVLPLPFYVALGHGFDEAPPRIFNVLYFIFPMLWLLFLHNLVVFTYQKFNFQKWYKLSINLMSLMLILLIPFSSSWRTAVEELIDGTAEGYHREMQIRFDKFKSGGKDAVVYIDTLDHKPITIFSGFDIHQNRAGGWSEVYESYFNVKQIILEGDQLSKNKAEPEQ